MRRRKMEEKETVSRKQAVEEVRNMAFQFADMYFAFVKVIREKFGEEEAADIAQRVLYMRASERAEKMIRKAEEEGAERTPENINRLSDVSYLGWDSSYGIETCPYGAQWNRRIAEEPWFRKFAALYCDVTDTTIAEVFTADSSHRLYKNVVLGDDSCERTYFPSDEVRSGKRTYAPDATNSI
ncbi:MAG: hypothetical protein IK049_03600 [Oscillospiraceae bacterium]|nr:hypothetical protein [Oscillospiraceae bacterium]MBR4928417.1 hypothetical protein [Oscillospiraceae bacterium]